MSTVGEGGEGVDDGGQLDEDRHVAVAVEEATFRAGHVVDEPATVGDGHVLVGGAVPDGERARERGEVVSVACMKKFQWLCSAFC